MEILRRCKLIGYLLLVLIFLLSAPLFPKEQEWPETFVQGYAKSRFGNTLTYHSPHPDVKSSLLVRSMDSRMYIEWETDPVPVNHAGEFINFIWMFGIDVNTDSHRFKLYVNDKHRFSFKNPLSNKKKEWRLHDRSGAQLIFRATMIDKYEDFMGYITLKLPKKQAPPGCPLILKIVGESANSRSWYMTFKSGVKSEVKFEQEDILLGKNNQLFQGVRIKVVHLSKPMLASIILDGVEIKKITLKPGFNSFRFLVPEIKTPTELTCRLRITNLPEILRKISLRPVRKWTVYLVQHTHTDIGYTRPQSTILPEHLQFIDYALECCDFTDSFPEDAKFRWTCETSWAVQEYLKRRPPEQVRRLKKRVLQGQIELTSMFLNYSEVIDEAQLAAQLQPVKLFIQRDLPVKTAMQNDINGIGWCLVDYFKNIGIEYVIMGEHGHRALIPFKIPTLFWWESPAAQRVMAYRADHYMTGNKLGIHTCNLDIFEPALINYLSDLIIKGYPFNQISLQYSGYVTDNSPPSIKVCELIKIWNRKYEWPKLRSATAVEFMNHMKSTHAHQLPVYRVGWPDWWTDGVGSAAQEVAMFRRTQAMIPALKGLLAISVAMGDEIPKNTLDKLSNLQENVSFFAEHTYGAAESISDPKSQNSLIQWSQKASYIWQSAITINLLLEEAMGRLHTLIPNLNTPTLTVFNTLNWDRSGMVNSYIHHDIVPRNQPPQIIDAQGKSFQAVPLKSREDGTQWAFWVENIPALGYKVYQIRTGESPKKPIPYSRVEDILENNYYRLLVDTKTGAIKSLYDKELNLELVDVKSKWQLGQFIYERLSNRQQLESFTLMETPRRTTLERVKVGRTINGPLWKSIHIHGQVPGCSDSRGIDCEIRLLNNQKKIQFLFNMRKLPVISPEAVYIAFPFCLPKGEIIFEVQGALMRPGKDQLPGTASDWNTIQNFALVRNREGQIIFGSPDIPLVQFGDINTGKFQYKSHPEKPYIFSWVLNNYWTTNFKASQEGELSWSYFLTSTRNPSNHQAYRLALGSRVSLLSRVRSSMGKSLKGIENLQKSFLSLNHPNLLLISAKPISDKPAIILHLRELEGKKTELDLDTLFKGKGLISFQEVNVLGIKLRDLKHKLTFYPFEVKFLKLHIQ
jgi:hypothetical protein